MDYVNHFKVYIRNHPKEFSNQQKYLNHGVLYIWFFNNIIIIKIFLIFFLNILKNKGKGIC